MSKRSWRQTNLWMIRYTRNEGKNRYKYVAATSINAATTLLGKFYDPDDVIEITSYRKLPTPVLTR